MDVLVYYLLFVAKCKTGCLGGHPVFSRRRMMKESYLLERKYKNLNFNFEINKKKKEYWNLILGEKNIEELLCYNRLFRAYLEGREFEAQKREIVFLVQNIKNGKKKRILYLGKLKIKVYFLQNFTSFF